MERHPPTSVEPGLGAEMKKMLQVLGKWRELNNSLCKGSA